MSSVINPAKTRIVFCEGEPSSADVLLLRRVLKFDQQTKLDFQIVMQPLGGKYSIGGYVQGYFGKAQSRTVEKSDEIVDKNYVVFRDRDLDMPPDNGNLQKLSGKKPIFLSGLTCIESYFLDPKLLTEYLSTQLSITLFSEDDLGNLLSQTVLEQKEYQTVRWSLQELQSNIEAEIGSYSKPFRLGNRWTDKDGKLPKSLTLNDCKYEAYELIKNFLAKASIVSISTFDEVLRKYERSFNNPLNNDNYKLWFHGKDIYNAWLGKLDRPISQDHYREWAAQNFDWEKYADLLEFRQICFSEPLTEN